MLSLFWTTNSSFWNFWNDFLQCVVVEERYFYFHLRLSSGFGLLHSVLSSFFAFSFLVVVFSPMCFFSLVSRQYHG